MLNICSSVQDLNQSIIHRGSDWTNQRAKQLILKLKASEGIAFEENASEESTLEYTSSEARSSEARSSEASNQKLLHQKRKSVDKVQCTKRTTTNSAHASTTTISASCLYIKTRITVMFADSVPSLVEWIWNWFFIGQLSNQAKDQWWRIKASIKTSWCTG